jgi:hypothetical protein
MAPSGGLMVNAIVGVGQPMLSFNRRRIKHFQLRRHHIRPVTRTFTASHSLSRAVLPKVFPATHMQTLMSCSSVKLSPKIFMPSAFIHAQKASYILPVSANRISAFSLSTKVSEAPDTILRTKNLSDLINSSKSASVKIFLSDG